MFLPPRSLITQFPPTVVVVAELGYFHISQKKISLAYLVLASYSSRITQFHYLSGGDFRGQAAGVGR